MKSLKPLLLALSIVTATMVYAQSGIDRYELAPDYMQEAFTDIIDTECKVLHFSSGGGSRGGGGGGGGAGGSKRAHGGYGGEGMDKVHEIQCRPRLYTCPWA